MGRTFRFVVSALVLALFALACGGGGGEPEAEGGAPADQIVFWTTQLQPERVAIVRDIAAAFEEQSGIAVEISSVAEDELPSLMVANAASGTLPDVIYHPVEFAAGWAQQGLIDVEAANEVIETLGRDTFSEGALELVTVDDTPVTIPSDGWGQLLIYRRDLFEEAGLERPDTYERIEAAAAALHDPSNDLFGITMSTDPAAVFTQQTFEHFALANDCLLIEEGEVALGSQACVDSIDFYAHLIEDYSPGGIQTVESTRATYFAGRAAMVVWSPFILDEMAGLRDDALPNCPQCEEDPAFLAKNSGFVPAFSSGGAEPSQYGQISYLAIGADANVEAAQQFAEFWFTDAYGDQLSIAPEGQFPMRKGTPEDPDKFVELWRELEIGVTSEARLTEVYGQEIVETLIAGTENFDRWGLQKGYAQLASAVYTSLVVPQALADVLNGTLTPEQAATQLDEEVGALLQQAQG